MAADVTIYMRLYISDWDEATVDLTLEEECLYARLIRHMWKRGGTLVLDHARLATACRVSKGKWGALWPTIRHFFTLSTDGLTFTQKRLQEEMAAAIAGRDRKATAGKVGANVRWQAHASAMATALRPHVETNGKGHGKTMAPYPSSVNLQPLEADPDPPIPPRGVVDYSADFERFWLATNRLGSKHKALLSWQKAGKPDADRLIASWARWMASEGWANGYGAKTHPVTWLNGHMHEQEPVPARSAPAQRNLAVGHVRAEGHEYGEGEQKL